MYASAGHIYREIYISLNAASCFKYLSNDILP